MSGRTRFLVTLLHAGLALAVLPAFAQAAAGDLDGSFSRDGRQVTDFAGGFDTAAAAVPQPDGKIVAAGRAATGGGANIGVARYKANGGLDTGFSVDGRVVTDFGPNSEAFGVALQPDGKIVVAGEVSSDDRGTDFALVRYKANGALDTTFSGDGKQTTDFGGDDDRANGIVLQPDGKIVVSGFALRESDYEFALARYKSGGAPDTTLSRDGKQTTNFAGGEDQGNALALQPDGKIVVAGHADIDSSLNIAMVRYKPNGGLDTTWSGDGRQTTNFNPNSEEAHGVVVQPDGKVVVAGYALTAGTTNFALVRYTPNGEPDLGFSRDGKQTTDFEGAQDQANAIVREPDGRLAVAGYTDNGSSSDMALARYRSNGALDTSFSGDGRQTTDFGSFDVARDLIRQADGRLVAVGSAFTGQSYNFALARYFGR